MTQPFWFDAGNLALDLANTGGAPFGRDALSSPRALLDWLSGAGILPQPRRTELEASPPDARLLLSETVRLRDAVHSGVASLAVGRALDDGSLLVVNGILAARRSWPSLRRDDQGLSIEEIHDVGTVRAILSPVAEALAGLLLDADPSRLRRCLAEDCRSWFLDTSKNGRRKWCSMARCGNRAKAAAHHRRRRPD